METIRDDIFSVAEATRERPEEVGDFMEMEILLPAKAMTRIRGDAGLPVIVVEEVVRHA